MPELVIKNKYRIVRQVGRGGMGAVYEVVHELLGTTFALKQLHVDFQDNPEIASRFREEAQMMARLRHNHIVRVFDIDSEEGFGTYLVMEFITGRDLNKYIKAHGRLDYAEVIRIGAELASALECAHTARPRAIIHRDIKPANVLIEDGSGRAVLTDFGIAKQIAEAGGDESVTRTGSFIGTYRYSSPEQIRNEKNVRIDARADIYSLGVVLYEMLSGKRFLDGYSEMQIAHYVAFQKDWQPPLEYPEPPPDDLAELVRECLAKDRERRVATAGDVARRLQNCLRGGATPAPLPPLRPQPPSPASPPVAEPAPVAAREISPTAPTVIPGPTEDSTAAARREAEERERARLTDLIQSMRGETERRSAEWRRLLGELRTLNIVPSETQDLPDYDDRLRAIAELEEQGQLASAVANLEALNDRLGTAARETQEILEQVIRSALDGLGARWQELRQEAGDLLEAAHAAQLDAARTAVRESLAVRDWTRCRTALAAAETALEQAWRESRTRAAAALRESVEQVAALHAELTHLSPEAARLVAVDPAALAAEVEAEVAAGRLRAARAHTDEALRAVRGAHQTALAALATRAAAARERIEELVATLDLPMLQRLAAAESARAGRARTRAREAEQRGDHAAAAELYSEALAAYERAREQAAQNLSRSLSAAEQELREALQKAVDAPAEVVGAARQRAEAALAATSSQPPADAIAAVQEARASLAAAIEEVPTFRAASEQRGKIEQLRTRVAGLEPMPEQLGMSDRALQQGEEAFAARRWSEASERYAQSINTLATLERDLRAERERQRAQAQSLAEAERELRALLDESKDAPAEVAGAAQQAAAEALRSARVQPPAEAIGPLRDARASLVAALQDVPLFREACARATAAEEARKKVTALAPAHEQTGEADGILAIAAAAFSRRNWAEASRRYAEAADAFSAAARDVLQARDKQQMAMARAEAQPLRGAIDAQTAASVAADRFAGAARAYDSAEQAERRAQYAEATAQYRQAAALYREVQQSIAEHLNRRIAALEGELRTLIGKCTDQPALLVGESRRTAQAALERPRGTDLAVTLRTYEDARDGLARALTEAPLFSAAAQARAAAESAVKNLAVLEPGTKRSAPIDALLKEAETAFAQRQWQAARERFAQVASLAGGVTAELLREREKAAAAAAREKLEKSAAAVDVELARQVAAEDLRRAQAARSRATEAEKNDAFAAAAPLYEEAAAAMAAAGEKIARHLATQIEAAQRALKPLLEQAAKAPAAVVEPARGDAQQVLDRGRGSDPASHLRALQSAHEKLGEVLQQVPVAAAATELQGIVREHVRVVAELRASRAQRRAADDAIRRAEAALKERNWSAAREIYSQTAEALSRLEQELRLHPPRARTLPASALAGGGGAAALAIALVAMWVLEVGPFAPEAKPPALPRRAAELPVPAPAAAARIASAEPAAGSLTLRETENQRFAVALEGPAGVAPEIRWLLDGREMKRDTTTFDLATDHSSAEQTNPRTLRVVVGGGKQPDQVREWTVRVDNVNRPPTLTGLPSAAKVQARRGETLKFQVNAADADGDRITYAWNVDGKPTGKDANELELPVDGDHRVAVVASDGTAEVRQEWELAALPVPPSELTLDFKPKQLDRLRLGEKQELALFAPREAGALSYTWSVDGEKVSDARSFTFAPRDPQLVRGRPVKITASARDQSGRTFSRDWNVRVLPPPPPSIRSTSPSQRTLEAMPGERVPFRVAAADPVEGQTLTYVFSVDGEPVAREQQGDFIYTSSDDKAHRIEAHVEDSFQQASASVSWSIEPAALRAPPPTPVAAAAAIRALAQQWVNEYQQALNAKDANKIGELRGLDAASRAKLSEALKTQRDLRVTLSNVKVEELAANRARVSYKRNDSWVDPGGKSVTPPTQVCEHELTLSANKLAATTRCELQ